MGQEAQALLPLLLRRGDHHPARDELHKVCACIVQRLHVYLICNLISLDASPLKLVVHVICLIESESGS